MAMKQGIFEVIKNEQIAESVMKIVLVGDVSAITAPGQFVNIKIDGFFLRRPLSVCDCSRRSGELTLVYKIVGEGTRALAGYREGSKLDLLTGLGNGYDTALSGERPLLLGGGAGVPPMFFLCRSLVAAGKSPTAVLGFNTKKEIFYEEEFRKLGAQVIVTTADGSYGTAGFVTDAMRTLSYTYFYACGPQPMLHAVYEASETSGQFSFEERMGCGFGACMGCSCRTKYGGKRICKDGPVLVKEEIIW